MCVASNNIVVIKSKHWLGTFQLDLQANSFIHIDNLESTTPSNYGSLASNNKS